MQTNRHLKNKINQFQRCFQPFLVENFLYLTHTEDEGGYRRGGSTDSGLPLYYDLEPEGVERITTCLIPALKLKNPGI